MQGNLPGPHGIACALAIALGVHHLALQYAAAIQGEVFVGERSVQVASGNKFHCRILGVGVVDGNPDGHRA